MDINDRIKEVRQQLGLSQTAFAEECGLGRDVISNIELHRNTVTKLYIKLVVENFGVNEEWLRTGELPMFLQTKEQYIDTLAEQYGLDDFAKKVITVYSELSADEKKVIKNFIEKLNGPEPMRLLLAGQGGSAEVEVKDPEGASNALKELKESKHKK